MSTEQSILSTPLGRVPDDDVVLRRDAEGAHHKVRDRVAVPRTVNGTGHTGPSEFCATSI